MRNSGYHRIAIIDTNGKRSALSVHKLVAILFIGPQPSNEYTIDHIDRNPSNNHYSNLRWATLNQQITNKSNNGKSQGRSIDQFDLEGNFIRKWDTAQQAANELGLGNGIRNIPAVCTGKRNNACGFIWRYAEDFIDGEIWRYINDPNYADIQVSNIGRIKTRK